MRVIVKFTVENAACVSLRLTAYGEFDSEFDYDSQEWSCSKYAFSWVRNIGNRVLEAAVNLVVKNNTGWQAHELTMFSLRNRHYN